jgi:RNA polymerase sigma factor (sigma-70 family)
MPDSISVYEFPDTYSDTPAGEAQVWMEEVARIYGSEHFRRRVMALCARYRMDDEAEDVRQQAVLKINRYFVHYPERIREIKNLEGYVFITAHNVLINMLRARRNATAHKISLDDMEASGSTAEHPATDPTKAYEAALQVEELLSSLPLQEVELLQLYFVEKMTFWEIAEKLDIAAVAARKRQSRLLEKLRERLI